MTRFVRPDTALIVRQRLAEGVTILDRVLLLDPRYPGARRFKATLHRMQGQPDAERSAREQAEAVEP